VSEDYLYTSLVKVIILMLKYHVEDMKVVGRVESFFIEHIETYFIRTGKYKVIVVCGKCAKL
jgi:hypothetical protein